MRRVVGLTVTGLGAFLLVFGLLMRYWVPGQVIKYPLNEYSVTTLSGNDITYFSPSLLREFPHVAATAVKTIEGDVPSGSSSVAVWGEFTAIEDTTDHTAIQYASQRSAFDRRTGLLVNCCAASVGSNSKVIQAGQGFRFPFGTRHRTYEVFDSTLLAQVAVQFAGTGTIDGLPVDKFVEHVDNRGFGQQTLPGSLLGEPQQATVTLPESLTATNTYWVDPLTGATVDVTLNQTVELQGTTPAERLVLLGGTLSETAPSVRAAVADAQQQHPKIALIQVTIPLIGILVGIIALAIGIALVLRSPEPWVPAYDDDEVEDMAR
jgi:Porin PorA